MTWINGISPCKRFSVQRRCGVSSLVVESHAVTAAREAAHRLGLPFEEPLQPAPWEDGWGERRARLYPNGCVEVYEEWAVGTPAKVRTAGDRLAVLMDHAAAAERRVWREIAEEAKSVESAKDGDRFILWVIERAKEIAPTPPTDKPFNNELHRVDGVTVRHPSK